MQISSGYVVALANTYFESTDEGVLIEFASQPIDFIETDVMTERDLEELAMWFMFDNNAI